MLWTAKQSFVHLMKVRSLAMAIALGLLVNACSSGSAGNSASQAERQEVPVTVTDSGCQPGQLTVDAGRTTFVITNKSNRAVEWEILEGVMVVEEKENIAPGFVQKLKAELKVGAYVMTCGLRSNPQGKIVVTAAKSDAQPNASRLEPIATTQTNAVAP